MARPMSLDETFAAPPHPGPTRRAWPSARVCSRWRRTITGGIGPSGMEPLSRPRGVFTFSKARAVLRRGRFQPGLPHSPP